MSLAIELSTPKAHVISLLDCLGTDQNNALFDAFLVVYHKLYQVLAKFQVRTSEIQA